MDSTATIISAISISVLSFEPVLAIITSYI